MNSSDLIDHDTPRQWPERVWLCLPRMVLACAVFGVAVDIWQSPELGDGWWYALPVAHLGYGVVAALMVAFMGWCLRSPQPGGRLRALVSVLPILALCAGVIWSLGHGRGLREAGLRWVFMVAAGFSALIILVVAARLLGRVQVPSRGSRALLGSIALVVVILVIGNERILPGIYAPMHEFVVVVSTLLIALMASLVPPAVGTKVSRYTYTAALGLGAVSALLIWGGLFPLSTQAPGLQNLLAREARQSAHWLSIGRRWAAKFRGGSEGTTGSKELEAELLPRSQPIASAGLDARFPMRRKFNVVLVTVDTLRADHVGAYGYARNTTPQLDAFAKQSLLFRRAYAQYPSSQLSLASLFQGLYPEGTDIADQRMAMDRLKLPLLRAPLARILRDQGSRTAAVSALAPKLLTNLIPYARDGFERFNEFEHFDFLAAEDIFKHATKELDRFDDSSAATPWFLWAHFFDPHDPYDDHGNPEFPADNAISLYDGEIRYADAAVGKLIARLEARADWDRTVVIVHADHGEEFGEHGGRYHNSSLFDEQLRVPLLIRIPGQEAQVIDRVVELVDVLPTILELMDIDPRRELHGDSLLPLLQTEGEPTKRQRYLPPNAAFMQLREDSAFSPRSDAVVVGDFKLIHHVAAGVRELYDLSKDPTEQANLAAKNPTRLAELERWLSAFRSRVNRSQPEERLVHGDEHLLTQALDRRRHVDQRQLDLARLLMRGRRAEVTSASLKILTHDEESEETKVMALRTTALAPDLLVRDELLARLTDSSPQIRLRAAITLAALPLGAETADDAARGALVRLSEDTHPGVAAGAALARGLMGDAAVKPLLHASLPHLHGEFRILATCALAILGEPKEQEQVWSLMRAPEDPEWFAWAVRVAARTSGLDSLFSWEQALRQAPSNAWWNDSRAIIAMAERRPMAEVAPLVRFRIESRSRAGREFMLAALGEYRQSPLQGAPLLKLHGEDFSRPARAARALAASVRRAASRGVLDWIRLARLQHALLASDQSGQAEELASFVGLSAEHEKQLGKSYQKATSIIERFSALVKQRDSSIGARSGLLELSHLDGKGADGPRILVLKISAKLSSLGGPGHQVVVKVRAASDHSQNPMVVPLQTLGLLKGESTEIMIPLRKGLDSPSLLATLEGIGGKTLAPELSLP